MMISTEQEFISLIDRALGTDSVGIDTEFIWERTYYPRLGLIQIALSDEDCQLIDPLAVEDLTPLGRLLGDFSVVKILHDAPQDLAILSRVTGVIPQNIFDTRIAAGFSGLSSTTSLVRLMDVLLDIDLPKTETRTNWLKRPLDHSQVDYALDDVRYLRALRVLLLARIIDPQVESWLSEELQNLSMPEMYDPIDDRTRFLKIKGSSSLDRRGLAILRELASLREQEAQSLDRPRGHIFTDKALLKISREKPTSKRHLAELDALSPKKLKRYNDAIVIAVRQAMTLDDNDLPQSNRRIRLNAKEKAFYGQMMNYLEATCASRGIDAQLIGNNSELKQLIKNRARGNRHLPVKFMDGWRNSLLNDFFQQH
ncbi:MAG: HRDC domain-containing protein [Desulfofustis sp.]